MVYLATHDSCAKQAFNIRNGDAFRWEQVWPAIAAWFGLEVAPPVRLSLQQVMADKGEVWSRLAKRHDLKVRRKPKQQNPSKGQHQLIDFDLLHAACVPRSVCEAVKCYLISVW